MNSIALTRSRLTRGAAGLVLALACATAALAGAKEDIQADFSAGRWLSAEQRLQEVLAKHPDNALAHYWHAQALLKLDRKADARTALQAALKHDPDLKFAKDRALLQKIARELNVALSGAAPADGPQLVDSPSTPQVAAVAPPAPQPAPRAESRPVERKSSSWPMFLGIGALFLVLWLWLRKRNQSADRGDIVAALRGARDDLQQAMKASDANPAFSAEQKLANYDVVRAAQARLDQYASRLQSGQGSAADVAEAEAAVWQARDLAADLRGQERPSLRRSRAEQMRHEEAMARAQYQQPTYQGGGGGVGLGTAAAVGVGAALLTGAVMAGTRESHHGHGNDNWRDDDNDRNRFDNSPGFDVGGSGGDFDSGGGGGDFGGSDSGGGGGDFD